MSADTPANALPLPAELSREPIPGYTVTERIGVGGNGEVWKADAPGGLAKAVKFVYGRLDEDRASKELKSLNRIREVRHPFLLSLDRIEAVAGHLIIVSELAESNLKEQFDECREAGMPGIPRDRLIGFLRDTADALDYLCEDHGLQHLDIKPENLLLIGGHVKVADFGLVKELSDCNASIMGGLTPNYAPPEVFDGRPARRSDQYSLAIVFQEMLTGTLPFTGRTAAQLAAQHLHSRPRMDALSPADRNIIGRALSKDPAKRYPSCRELVAALADPKTAGGTGVPTAKTPIPRPTRGTSAAPMQKTVPLAGASDTDAVPVDARQRRSEYVAKTLPPVELSGENEYRPTIFIGVGGTAGMVLTALSKRIEDRIGDPYELPALQMLLLDTDRNALAHATQDSKWGKLDVQQTLALPLRATQDYRGITDKFLGSMSRRWIYNVPRSLQTEGMRPLGRLALIDHYETVIERIRQAIAVATDAQAIEETATISGLSFTATAPRIYLIGSTSGGTGSGMLLDLAYATRQALADADMSDEGVYGILTHSTKRAATTRDLSIASTLACLTELNHFSQPSSYYPGEAGCGLTTAQGKTFHHAYFTHLGEDLDQKEYEAAVDQVAEFVYQNTVTPAVEFFDRCRAEEGTALEISCPETSLRTFGLCQLGYSNSELPAQMADPVCRGLIDEWRGATDTVTAIIATKFSEQRAPLMRESNSGAAVASSVEDLAAKKASALELRFSCLADTMHTIAKLEMGRNPDAYRFGLVAQYVAGARENGANPNQGPAIKEILDLFDTTLGTNTEDCEPTDKSFVSLAGTIEKHLLGLADHRGEALQQWCYKLADESRGRIKAAQFAANWFNQHLKDLSNEASKSAKSSAVEASKVRAELCLEEEDAQAPSNDLPTGHGKDIQTDPRVAEYFSSRLNEVVMQSVMHLTRRIANVHVAAITHRCRDLLRDLGQVANELATEAKVLNESQAQSGSKIKSDMDVRVLATLAKRLPEFVGSVERQLFGETSALQQMLRNDTDIHKSLPDQLRNAAKTVIQSALRSLDVQNTILPPKQLADVDPADHPLQQCLAEATPRVATSGCGKRLLAVLPDQKLDSEVWEAFEEQLGEPINVILNPDADLVFCYESEGLPLMEIADQVLDGRYDLAPIAARLHTRVDVDWTSL